MKKTMKGFVVGFLVCSLLSATVVFGATGVMKEIFYGVNVVVDGQPVNFSDDMQPFVMDNRTFLPLRAMSDVLGESVDYDAGTNTAYVTSGTADTSAGLNNPLLQEDVLKNYSNSLMEDFYSDFAAGNTPALPGDITNDKINIYYRLYFESIYGDQVAHTQTFTVSKDVVDGIANLFGKDTIDLRDVFGNDNPTTYDSGTNNYTVECDDGLYLGYHNKETFDYTLSNVDITGDTATVTYNTYYTEDFNKFMNAGDVKTMPSWTFTVKAGLYTIQYKAENGKIVIGSSVYTSQPDFMFYTQ